MQQDDGVDKVSKSILITGATSAIGRALAVHYATHGYSLHLHGRNGELLEQVAAQCSAIGAKVQSYSLDLLDTDNVVAWLQQLLNDHSLDLFIANAGINTNIGKDLGGESITEMQTLLDLNVKATLLTTALVAKHMQANGRGQIALMSSLAGYYGLPKTPSYCASKAAVKSYGESLRGWLAPFGVQVSVIMPGYVQSPMCNAMPGPKLFKLQPEQAAVRIAKGLKKNKARISFPFPLNFGTWWLSILPASLSQFILSKIGY